MEGGKRVDVLELKCMRMLCGVRLVDNVRYESVRNVWRTVLLGFIGVLEDSLCSWNTQ